mmetsp:Transcript_57236/g.181070  ORF Transcript_57236/g.181070 Transcript_57236/m.181070 type:complete len:171 (+) Transcript_57236:126-638(+)
MGAVRVDKAPEPKKTVEGDFRLGASEIETFSPAVPPLRLAQVPEGGGNPELCFRSEWAREKGRMDCAKELRVRCEHGARATCSEQALRQCRPPTGLQAWFGRVVRGREPPSWQEREVCEAASMEDCMVKMECREYGEEVCSRTYDSPVCNSSRPLADPVAAGKGGSKRKK